jgi:hypothetical protein
MGHLKRTQLRSAEARRVSAEHRVHFGELFPACGVHRFIVTSLETNSRAVVRGERRSVD